MKVTKIRMVMCGGCSAKREDIRSGTKVPMIKADEIRLNQYGHLKRRLDNNIGKLLVNSIR